MTDVEHMTRSQALDFATKLRSAYPKTFMLDSDVANWAEALERYTPDEAMYALAVLHRHYADVDLTLGLIVEIIEGERSRRFKCGFTYPNGVVCGIGFASQDRVEEHHRSVHAGVLWPEKVEA